MKNHYKLWTILSLIIVFAAGVLSGILIDSQILDKKSKRTMERTDQKRRSSSRFPTLDMMAEELGLSEEQKEQIREIFKNNEERFRALRKDNDDRLRTIRSQLNKEIRSVLTEEQEAKYEAMIQKYHEQRKKEMEARKRQSENQDKKGDKK